MSDNLAKIQRIAMAIAEKRKASTPAIEETPAKEASEDHPVNDDVILRLAQALQEKDERNEFSSEVSIPLKTVEQVVAEEAPATERIKTIGLSEEAKSAILARRANRRFNQNSSPKH